MTHEEHAARKIARLHDALNNAMRMIADIRYRNWPSGTTEALGLDADRMDVLLGEGDSALRYASSRKKTEDPAPTVRVAAALRALDAAVAGLKEAIAAQPRPERNSD